MTLLLFAAASPAGWPLWVDIVLLVGLVVAAVISPLARRSQPMSPAMSGFSRWNLARNRPLWHGALLGVLVFIGSWYVMATHLPPRQALLIALLMGAGAGFLGGVVAFLVQRSEPTT